MRCLLCLLISGCLAWSAEPEETAVVPVALAAELLDQAAGASVYDHRAVDRPLPTTEAIDRVAGLRVAIGRGPGDDLIEDGLAVLIAEHPDLAVLRRSTRPRARFYADGGGVGLIRAGHRDKTESRVADFAASLAEDDLADQVDIALLSWSPSDISAGRRVETTSRRYGVMMEIRSYHVGLADVFTDSIETAVTRNGVTGTANYPIELPNVEVFGLSTTAYVPAGSSPPRQALSPRYPGLAYALYAEALDTLQKAYPATRQVYATVPLEKDDNLQRNHFNTLVRRQVQETGGVLLDVADVLARQEDGTLARDRQGPRLADRYRDAQFNDRLTTAAKRAVGRALLALLVDRAQAGTASSAAHETSADR